VHLHLVSVTAAYATASSRIPPLPVTSADLRQEKVAVAPNCKNCAYQVSMKNKDSV